MKNLILIILASSSFTSAAFAGRIEAREVARPQCERINVSDVNLCTIAVGEHIHLFRKTKSYRYFDLLSDKAEAYTEVAFRIHHRIQKEGYVADTQGMGHPIKVLRDNCLMSDLRNLGICVERFYSKPTAVSTR